MSNLIIAAIVVIVVGLALFSTVTSSVQDAKSDPNTTARDKNLLGLIPLGYILLLLFGSGTLFYFGAHK